MQTLRRSRALWSALAVLLVLAFVTGTALAGAPAAPQAAPAGQGIADGPIVRYADADSGSVPLKTVFPLYEKYSYLYEIPRKWLPNRTNPAQPEAPDPNWQDTPAAPNVPGPLTSWDGVNNRNSVLPPDPTGDIGPNHYVQAVNLSFAVYSRTGALLYGPADIRTLFAGMGGVCETSNDGDPIVLYDQGADRWLISQFALPNYPRGPFYQCIAISKTGDPTGEWWRYQFTVSSTKMNDYPKFGVWPDGYYMAVNQFNQGRLTWGGQGVVVFERSAMLNGQTARMVYFDLYSRDPNLGGMLPADWDGATAPPAGAANPYIQVDDNAWGYSPDQLQIWNFHVDWANVANSTFTKVGTVAVNAFDSDMCGGSRNCIPQPGGTAVDAISDRLMYRLQYRNFGDRQTLVVNHTVDATGSDRAGVRWYELRNTGSGWSIYQQATYSPDATHRWMGSVAMNGAGDMALGFSASSTSVYPSVRYTGRLNGDALNQMTQGEADMVTGGGYQSHSSGRWGDYSQMTVDPTDDCTFWYTQEYYANSASSAGWQTRIGSFKLRDCGGTPPVDNPPTVSITNPADGATVSGTISVTADASDDKGVNQVEFFVDNVSIGVDTTAPYAVNWNTTTYANGAHAVKAIATDTVGQTAQDVHNVTVSNVAPASTMHVGDLDGTGTSQNALRWQASVKITVHDASHQPLSGASVSGAWSGGSTGTSSCTTAADGTCTVTKSALPRRTAASVTFTINSVSKSGYTYDSGANHDPDGDSNGTTITVSAP